MLIYAPCAVQVSCSRPLERSWGEPLLMAPCRCTLPPCQLRALPPLSLRRHQDRQQRCWRTWRRPLPLLYSQVAALTGIAIALVPAPNHLHACLFDGIRLHLMSLIALASLH